jgi:plastocyanin
LKAKLVISLGASLAAGLLLWVPLGAGEPSAAGTDAKPQKVWVEDNFFDKRSVRLQQNEKVVWVWRGANRHNVRFTKVPNGAARGGSGTQSDGRWRRVFHVPGTYRYICKLYTGMRGTVTVAPAQ